MLIDPNLVEFYTPAEARARMAELTYNHHNLYRLSDHNELKDQQKRQGEWLHSSELILAITRMNPLIWVEHQINFPNDWGFYTTVGTRKVFVCQLPKGWMREFTTITVDDRDLGIDKVHGWRQVLLGMLGKGLLTWKQVQEEFGDAEGVNADRWAKYTRIYRYEAMNKIRLNLAESVA